MKIKPVNGSVDMIDLVAETEYEECLLSDLGSMSVEVTCEELIKGNTKSIRLSFTKE